MAARKSPQNDEPTGASDLGPVVSSAHLAGQLPALSELEFGMIMAWNAFTRWMVRAMAAVGYPELGWLDVLVLHSVNSRGRSRRLADICLILNIEDTHTVTYSLKKLQKAALVTSGRQGKEKIVTITEKGQKACEVYRDIREQLLVKTIKDLGLDPEQASRLASLLRALSGHYDQAARSAAAM